MYLKQMACGPSSLDGCTSDVKHDLVIVEAVFMPLSRLQLGLWCGLSIMQSFDSDPHFSKVFSVPLVLVGLLDLVQRKDLRVDDRLDIVCLNGPVHLLELCPTAHVHPADHADVRQGVQDRGLLLSLHPSQEADHTDHSVKADGLERLGHGVGSADLDDVLDSTGASDLFGGIAPVLVFGIQDDVIGTERFDPVGLGLG